MAAGPEISRMVEEFERQTMGTTSTDTDHKEQPLKPRYIKQKNLGAVKYDLALFARLYIACQTRGDNLANFFTHEKQPWPLSLAKLGDVRSGTKAGLVLSLTLPVSYLALPGPDQSFLTTSDDRLQSPLI